MRIACFVIAFCGVVVGLGRNLPANPTADERDPSPVDLVVTKDESRALVVAQGTGQLVEVDLATGKRIAAIACGRRPVAVAMTPDEKTVVVTDPYDGDVTIIRRGAGSLTASARLTVGFEPTGVAISPDGKTAYVALRTGHAVAEIDLQARTLGPRFDVGRLPRSLAVSPDGKRMAVSVEGEGGVAIVDLVERKPLWTDRFIGINFGQMQTSSDGKYAYFPWMVYRHNPITASNIREGWVLASRMARIRLDEESRREAISLDARGLAVADPTGLALSPDEKTVVVTAGGTHELLVFRNTDLPYQDYGGPGDHIDAKLLKDKERFRRIPVPGRPLFTRFLKDGKTVLVANALTNAIDVVNLDAGSVTRSISLGGPATPSLARRGEIIFHDGKRSLDQWYSCQSCHQDGRSSAVTMDTKNDGRFGNFKTVLPLVHLHENGPYFWHGWEPNLAQGVRRSLSDTMLGPTPTDDDVDALLAYFKTLELPKNPHRGPKGELTEAAQRGEKVFHGSVASCSRCHSGPNLTDGRIHDVGTRDRGDVYKGYNTPSLRGVYGKTRLLHDGRSLNLEDLLRGPHNPDRVTGNGSLDDAELRDLIEFVKSL